jgi:hypothetical protein
VGGRRAAKSIPRPDELPLADFYALRHDIPAGNPMIEARGLSKFYGRGAVEYRATTIEGTSR